MTLKEAVEIYEACPKTKEACETCVLNHQEQLHAMTICASLDRAKELAERE